MMSDDVMSTKKSPLQSSGENVDLVVIRKSYSSLASACCKCCLLILSTALWLMLLKSSGLGVQVNHIAWKSSNHLITVLNLH